MTDFLDWSLVEAADNIASGKVSSTELTREAVREAGRWQPLTNAFLDLRAEAALAAAERADAAIGPKGPLHGVPLAHKDMFYRKGKTSTCGSIIRSAWVAPGTATALRRLDSAGAIDLGTLNMAEWAGGATGHNIHFGDACNPYSHGHIAGGSSSGTGAAVASRCVFGGLGSDTGGSIRLPAAACGVAGLKPTYGRVSRAAAMPRAWSLDCVGPLARTVRDCARLLTVIAGHDAEDPTSSTEPVPDYEAGIEVPIGELTIGVPDQFFFDEVDGPVGQLLDAAIDLFRRLAGAVVPVRPPTMQPLLDLGGVVSVVEAAAIHRDMMTDRPDQYSRNLFERTQAGFHVPAVLYLEALSARTKLLSEFCDAVFRNCDMILVPAIAQVLPTRSETDVDRGASLQSAHTRLIRCTRPFSYLGLPALSVPCGFAAGDLPVGFQLVGRPFAEATLLRAGHCYQQHTDHHRRRPMAMHQASA